MKTIDCRGLSCPEPVVQTKRAIGGQKELAVIVDNVAARENVTRLGNALGYDVNVKSDGGEYTLTLKKK
ncbi:MAG: sulfurtransferase TusA family protein [Bullifex sp.]